MTTKAIARPDPNALLSLGQITPTGGILPFAGSSAPAGWLLCQGQAVSRTTFARLFAVIGTIYGVGDGSTTFNVPDLGGRAVAGKEASATRLTVAGSGIDGATLGAAGGAQTGTATTTSSGINNINFGTLGGFLVTSASNTPGGGAFPVATTGDQVNTAINGNFSITVSGTSSAFSNVQPTIVLNYIIAT